MKISLPDIDFRSIRPLRGHKHEGFQELVVQIFQGETEGEGEFRAIEGSGGDGGVEAYRLRTDGTKVAVQSKYIDGLGANQWTQITNSVKTALKNHPTLCTYIIAVPLNRTPVQTERWDGHIVEWRDHAQSLGITQSIEFVWWGYTELASFSAKACYRNQLVYWLGVPEFDQEWLNVNNRANIQLLGNRYSPKQHIETESGIRLEAFAWGDDGKPRVLNAFLQVLERWRKVDRREFAEAKRSSEAKDMVNAFRRIMAKIISFRWPESGYPPINPLLQFCDEASDVCQQLKWRLQVLNETEKERRAKEQQGGNASHLSGPYMTLIHDLHELTASIYGLLNATRLCLVADVDKLVLIGEAGAGKSHLIADLIISAATRNQPALLLLGEQFLSNDDPWTASIKTLGWKYSADDLLAALEQEAKLAGRPALVCIDALNESSHRRLWQSHLIQFAERISHYPNVKLLVSCRSDFSRITLPESIQPGGSNAWPYVQHTGFGPEVIEAIEVYFKAFSVRTSYFPPALVEFRNPLFLRVFCEAFTGQELPSGPIGLDQVMRARIHRVCTQIQKEIDCDPQDTREALTAIAREIAENGGRPISRRIARNRAVEHFSNSDATTSLYSRLLSNGLLVESVVNSANPNGEEEVVVRFPFERFSDYFVANQILEGIETVGDLTVLFEKGGRLAHFRGLGQYYDNRGIARALAILTPERLKLEFAEVLSDPAVRELVLEDFLESLAWRSSASFSGTSEALLDEARKVGIDLFPTYIKLSTIPEHPFNSEYLGAKLARLSLPERDLKWTIPIAEESSSDETGMLREFLDWCFRAPLHLVSDAQAFLAARLLLWFCTSNHRALRKRSTFAAIRLLSGRPQIICKLLLELRHVDDPYLLERLYAVAAGVAFRLPSGEGLSSLATSVHEAVFAREEVTPNILTRDFASAVLEACLAKRCLPGFIAPASFRPPYKSTWPTILLEQEVERFERDESWLWIVNSVRSEEMGGYGDFGRYVMDSEVHNFSDKLLSEAPPDSDYRGRFSGMTARRWVLQRVEELGWSGERFGEYERQMPSGRQSPDGEELKLERISKKYQWIALRELTGFLADHYWMDQQWQSERIDFVGAWQLWGREFDPSQRLADPVAEKSADDGTIALQSEYPDPFANVTLCDDREGWVVQTPVDFSRLLRLRENTPDSGHPWLALAAQLEWIEPGYDRMVSNRRGVLKMWVNIRSFLVRKQDREQFVSRASQRNFYGNGVTFPEDSKGWIGEYPWGRAFAELRHWCAGRDERVGDVGVPYEITACTWSGGSTLIPSPQLCDLLSLEWAGEGAAFRTSTGGQVVGHLGGDAADWGRPLICREDVLKAVLDEAGLELVWCLVGERSCWCSETLTHVAKKELEISAVYRLNGDSIEGGFTRVFIQPLHGR